MDDRVRIGSGVVGLVLLFLHPVWRPWTEGAITEAFGRTVPTAALAILVPAVGTLWLLRTPSARRRGRPIVDALSTAAGLLSLVVFLNVYPLSLGRWDWLAQLALGLAIFGALLVLVVRLIRVGAVFVEATAASVGPAPDTPPAGPKRPTRQRPPPAPGRRR